nr:MAG TPA: hypothetical protein [Caudoviricetes sp.]
MQRCTNLFDHCTAALGILIHAAALLSGHGGEELGDFRAVRDLRAVDVQALDRVGKTALHAVRLGLDDLLGVGGGVGDLRGDLEIRRFAGVRAGARLDVVGHINVETGDAANKAVDEGFLSGGRGALGETVIEQEEGMNVRRDNDSTARVGDVRLVELRLELHDVLIDVGGGKGNGGGGGADGVTGSGTGGDHAEKVGVGNVGEGVGGAAHRGIDQLARGLHLVHVIDLEVEVLGLVNNKGLIGRGQGFGSVDVGILGVALHGDRTDGVDVDSVAMVADLALIVAVDEVGGDVRLFERIEKSGAPKLGNKSGYSHCELVSFPVEGRLYRVPILVNFGGGHFFDLVRRVAGDRVVVRRGRGVRALRLRRGHERLKSACNKRVEGRGVFDLVPVHFERGHFLAAATHGEVEVPAGDVLAFKVGADGLFLCRLALLCGDAGFVCLEIGVLFFVFRFVPVVAFGFERVKLGLYSRELFRVRLELIALFLQRVGGFDVHFDDGIDLLVGEPHCFEGFSGECHDDLLLFILSRRCIAAE